MLNTNVQFNFVLILGLVIINLVITRGCYLYYIRTFNKQLHLLNFLTVILFLPIFKNTIMKCGKISVGYL